MLAQALRMLARDWRAGELRVLAAALMVAVASVTSLAFFADRVSRALVRDAHQLLGADLVLVSDHGWQTGIAERSRAAAWNARRRPLSSAWRMRAAATRRAASSPASRR